MADKIKKPPTHKEGLVASLTPIPLYAGPIIPLVDLPQRRAIDQDPHDKKPDFLIGEKARFASPLFS